ncbi:MAG: hypothetical protein LKJ80_00505 [Oscillibacter sp.]|nr:hypothetical protein [Oscillibacter sp.]
MKSLPSETLPAFLPARLSFAEYVEKPGANCARDTSFENQSRISEAKRRRGRKIFLKFPENPQIPISRRGCCLKTGWPAAGKKNSAGNSCGI